MPIDYSSPMMLKLRRIGQQAGVLVPMLRFYRRAFKVSYEEGFDQEVLKRIVPGDVVWDVGANVGFFTAKFSDRVGPKGKVLAFEPSPATLAILKSRCGNLLNVELVNIALSDADGTAQFQESGEVGDPNNGLVRAGASGTVVPVAVRRGDSLCLERGNIVPTCIKIDVEGFEKEVLDGLSATLRSPRLKNVFVEVHFQILASRGLSEAPAYIKRLLTDCGFRVTWVDPSHLIAERPN
jgi:FkbM family methyltransferase